MKQQFIEIIALSVDSRSLTLWTPDGNTVVIPQGDHRVAPIVEEAKALGLAPGKSVTVNIANRYSAKQDFIDTEIGTNGFVKFFRVAKKKLGEFFADEDKTKAAEPVAPITIGSKDNFAVRAMHVFVASIEAAPKPILTIDSDNYGGYRLSIINRGEGSRVEAVALVSKLYGYSEAQTMKLLNTSLPIALGSPVSELQSKHYAKELSKLGMTVSIISPTGKTTEYAPVKKSNDQKLEEASAKLKVLGGISTDKPEFHEELSKEDTIVAVTSSGVVPDAHALHRQIRQASKLKDFKGFTKFLERLAPILTERRHSAEDLMKFMEKGNLPIADDGCIVIYKRLRLKSDPKQLTNDRVFIDCRTGQIEQAVGTKVQVLEELVDQNRLQDCSNGLHVATQDYIKTFSGDVTIIGKVAPEDVFAVPEYDVTKMRVSSYFIVAELPDEMRNKVNNGYPISSVSGGTELLNKVLSGNHILPDTLVTVGGHRGTKLTYTKLDKPFTAEVIPASSKVKTAIDMEENLTIDSNTAPVIKATDLKQQDKKGTNMDKADELWISFQNASTSDVAAQIAGELITLKGKMKCSWSKLGRSADDVQQLADARTVMPVQRTKAEPVKKVAAAKVGNSKIGDTIRSYLSDTGMTDYAKAHAMHDLKRAAKKSYTALGLTEDEVKAIDSLKHHLK